MEKHRHYFVSLLLVGVVLIGSWIGSDHGRSIDRESKISSESQQLVANYGLPTKNYRLASVGSILPPSVSAVSALVKDMSTGAELFNASPQRQWSLASLVKLMTAVVALENLPEDQLLVASRRAVSTEGAAGFLVVGKKYSISELLRSLLVFSSNDAAEVLAESLGREQFILAMNTKANQLKMTNTRFFDPSGLSALNQSTTEDLAKLIGYIFKERPQILMISREAIEGATHPFAGQPDFIGGKTGFIDEAGGNLVSLFNYQGRPLLIIVLGSNQRAEDTKILHDWFLQ